MPEIGSVFETKKSEIGLDIRFSSTLAHIDTVCTLVTQFMVSRGEALCPYVFAVNLVIREGLTNAIRHGNKNNPEKMVRFQIKIDTKIIRVSIEDQGAGFDRPSARWGPMSDEAEHGRGITIMETYFDRCRFNAKGNVLYLEKQISEPG